MDLVQLFDRFTMAVHSKDIEKVMEMVAEDAVFTTVTGEVFEGHAGVRLMEEQHFARNLPIPKLINIVLGDYTLVAEISMERVSGESVFSSAVFEFDQDGKIRRLRAYMQHKG